MSWSEIPEVQVGALPAGAHLLDVREPEEWTAGHIQGAQHIPMNDVPRRLDELPSDTPVYVVCRVGGRSAQVAAFLAQHGYDAVNLAGGMQAWAAAGREMVSENGRPPQVV